MRRGHFRSGVIESLMRRAGGRCSNPDCARSTIGPSSSASEKSATVGMACHIKGAQPGSPRYDSTQSEEERHSIENGIWLCNFCGGLVDKNGGVDFPVDTLKTWKRISEKAADERLIRSSATVKQNCIDTLIFINVPRLMHYAALTQSSPRFPRIFESGIPADGWIADKLVALERAIEALDFPALSWQDTVASVSDPVGLLVSFEGVFRTKNGPRFRSPAATIDFTDLKKAPHIYAKEGTYKFILPYDPRFLTTNTAVAEFSSGQFRAGGFALIKKKIGDEIWATPLFIGLWSSPEGRALMNALRSN